MPDTSKIYSSEVKVIVGLTFTSFSSSIEFLVHAMPKPVPAPKAASANLREGSPNIIQ